MLTTFRKIKHPKLSYVKYIVYISTVVINQTHTYMTSKQAEWDRKLFSYHGGYLTYYGEFIGRWKYGSAGMGEFKRFLMKNFTPDQYLDLLDQDGTTPMGILESVGFISKQEREKCRKYGLEETRQNVTYASILSMQELWPTEFTAEYIQTHYPGCPIPA